MKSKKANELARFNMPFELGLDLGTRTHDDLILSSKRCLILDIEKYRYQAALSDLGGSDIYSYGTKNQAENLIKSLRTWFTDSLNPVQPPAGKIYLEYTEFVSDLQILLKSEGFSQKDIRNLTNSEYTHYTNAWIQARPTTTSK